MKLTVIKSYIFKIDLNIYIYIRRPLAVWWSAPETIEHARQRFGFWNVTVSPHIISSHLIVIRFQKLTLEAGGLGLSRFFGLEMCGVWLFRRCLTKRSLERDYITSSDLNLIGFQKATGSFWGSRYMVFSCFEGA